METRERVLVLGDYRQTLTVVRSLSRAGFNVILGTDDPRSSTALSCHVSAVWRYAHAEPAAFRQELEAFLQAERPAFTFVVGESQLRALLPQMMRFEPLTSWVMPDAAAVAQCFDKASLCALTQQLGIPTPRSQPFTSAEQWRAAARATGYPVVIKRKDSSTHVMGRKAVIVASEQELDAFLENAGADPDSASLLLQEFAPGVRHNCHVAAADGELVAYFEQKVVRTDEIDDTGIGVAGISVPPTAALRGHCERLLGRLRYTGIGCVQFLVSGARIAFLEMNPRMDSTAALPYRLGYDFPLLAVQLAAYRKARAVAGLAAQRPSSLDAPYAAGKGYHWLYGDLHAWTQSLRAGTLGAGALAEWAIRMACGAATSWHLTWDLADPLPTAHMFWKRYAEMPLRWLRRRPRALRHV